MAISEGVILIVVILVLIYLMIYSKSKFIGSAMVIVLGGLALADENIPYGYSTFIIGLGLIAWVLSLFDRKK